MLAACFINFGAGILGGSIFGLKSMLLLAYYRDPLGWLLLAPIAGLASVFIGIYLL
jgi:hypothetical protein